MTPDHTKHVIKRQKEELVRQMKKMVIVLLGILLGLYWDRWQMDQVVDQKMNQMMRSSVFYIVICLLSSQ